MSNTVNVSTTTNQVVINPQSTKTVSVNSGGDTSITVNQGAANTINISNNVVNTSLTPTTVDITTPPSNGITVTDLRKTITVNQGATSTVQVATIGPQGPKGNKGDTGEQGPTGPVQDTGSLLITASYSNPNLTLTKGDGSTFNIGISTTTPTLAEVTAQGSSTTTAITASIISASGNLTVNKVGIGTTTPSFALDITGSLDKTNTGIVRFGSSGGGDLVFNENAGGSNETAIKFGDSGRIAGEGGEFNFQSFTNDFRFYTGSGIPLNGLALTINGSNGRVGIKTDTPGEALEVIGNISASSTILGGNLDINGPSNSHIEVGTYNVGYDSAPAPGFFVTGSGLIVSGAMADENHHNFIKIGETEIVDVKNAIRSTFLIHNVDQFIVSTGSDGGNLFGQGQQLIEHTGEDFRVYSEGVTIFNYQSSSDSLQFGTIGGTVSLNGNSSINGTFSIIAANTTETYTSSRHIAVFNTNPNSTVQEVKSLPVDTFFSTVTGAVTASAVSASNIVTGNTGSFNSVEGFISNDGNNRILTSNGNGTLTAESSFTINSGVLTGQFTSLGIQSNLFDFDGGKITNSDITIDGPNGHITASGNISGSGTGSFGYMNLPNLPTADPGVVGALFTTQSTGNGGNLDGQLVLLVSQG